MKILHVPFSFFPDPPGGTEVFVQALARALGRAGHDCVVAAPAGRPTVYDLDGLRVYRIGVGPPADVEELYDDGDAVAARAFGAMFDEERPDLVHLHAFTRACSLLVVREAHARGMPVVFTYHTPTVSCLRGTLLEDGRRPCDGVLDVRRCAACALQGLGAPRPAAMAAAAIPRPFARRLGRLSAGGRLMTMLRFSDLAARRHAAILALFEEVDRLVAPRQWVRALLVANGVPDAKIVVSPQGLEDATFPAPRPARQGGALRAAFLGRIDRTKGIDVVIRALIHAPALAVTLDVYGIVQENARGELEALQRLATGEARIRFREPLAPSAVRRTLAAYDVLVVPSQCLETGPLVVLEALAAGVPIVGSALGGVSELVQDGVDGRLIAEFDSPRAWAEVLAELAGHPQAINRLRRNIAPPRSIEDVARDMNRIYRDLVGGPMSVPSAPAAVPL